MNMFDVYQKTGIRPVKARGCWLWDDKGKQYLDLYGGHAVISVGHSHPHYLKHLQTQMQEIGFYSNAVHIPLQEKLSKLLGQVSGYDDYALFLCNSGAEANENALKLASFHTGRRKVISFHNAFHGRTSGALAVTDNPEISAPINKNDSVIFLPLNDSEALEKAFTDEIAAVIIEGIQGVGGIHVPTTEFMQTIRGLCDRHSALFICDEIQSGYGRTGNFFAHQHFGVKPDLITMAKGMGNGFPVAGLLIHPKIKSRYGLLGSTFGGNHLACAASVAVLEIILSENLIARAATMGDYLKSKLANVSQITEIRGMGLMIGLSFDFPTAEIREKLLHQYRIFTGNASDKHLIRLLPPLTVSTDELDLFVSALHKLLP